MAAQALPIDPLLPDLVAALAMHGAVVLQAPPGAGKTTRVPQALLAAGHAEAGEILVLQPRRLPTLLAARRVAEELGEEPGERIGYAVRFEERSSARTRVRFVTEGVLLRRLLAAPTLPGVACVVLDEFHERHLDGDLALALLAALRGARADLRLVVMSATLDAAPVAAFLGAPILTSEGRRFEVAIEHAERPSERPLDEQVMHAVRRILREGPSGDVLVFLPGAAEIRRAAEALAETAAAHAIDVLTLHGDLPLQEQTRVVRPGPRRKVILSTNVAETSVTIEGVTAVVDSGLARVAACSPWTGLPTLSLAKISQASATQRAGRAGRLAAGRALRLYTRADHDARAAHDLPEVRRLDLAEAALVALGAGTSARALHWLDAPPEAALAAAEALLERLGATRGGALTDAGRRMLSLPVHPRLGRLVVEAEARGIGRLGALVAALLSERDVRTRGRGAGPSGPSDLTELAERVRSIGRGQRAAALGLEQGAATRVVRAAEQLGRRVQDRAQAPRSHADEEQAIGLAILAAFPDRVARRRTPRGRELVLAEGGTATLAEDSVVTEAELLVAVDVEERSGPGQRAARTVRLASAVEPEWLLEVEGGTSETEALAWSERTSRVERVQRLAYGAVVLEERWSAAPPGEEASRILAEVARARGPSAFDLDEAESALARVALVAAHHPDAELLQHDGAEDALVVACSGITSLAELGASPPAERVVAALGASGRALVEREAPARVTLPGGRPVQVRYVRGQAPFIESRLQDFFGMKDGPRILGGRVALVLHLLAPNGRAVQVTQDLAGFWARHYPALRRELGRRYPRHAWPEDPLTATPPAPKPPRR